MPETKAKHDAADVNRLLAATAKTMQSARYCWLATAAGASARHVRPMGRLPNDPGEDAWKIRFLTDGRSRKATDIRLAGEVTILFQHDPDLAFVTLIGKALLHEDLSETRSRWKPAYDVYFPSETDRANAIFVDVEAERMELWIRGVTPEPFGLRATVLERDAAGWRLVGESLARPG
jgi:general stress protein 26